MPAFSSPIDCTPWVTGGLWPAELSTVPAETASLAEHLKADLQRIAHAANDELKLLKRAGMTDPSRQAAEAQVIDEARARAVRRVESTIRYLHGVQNGGHAPAPSPPSNAHLDTTQVLPAIREVKAVPEASAPSSPEPTRRPGGRRHRRESAVEPFAATDARRLEETQVIPVVGAEPHSPAPPERASESAGDRADSGRHHAVNDEEPAVAAGAPHLQETQVIPVVTQPESVFEAPTQHAPEPAPAQTDSGRRQSIVDEPVAVGHPHDEKPSAPTEFDDQRLNRLLEFVVRQEPRLNWAIGERTDGTTVLVTDLAHGWIPSGISLPAGVRLLEPQLRSGRVAALIGETARIVSYTPGDSLRRSADFAATRSSVEPRALPAVDDVAGVLRAVTRGRDDLPKIVPRLAGAAAAGTDVVDQEVDVLRVHLDTARYQLLVQYPKVNPALLLKCMLMAATEGIASGDAVSANYHLSWYRTLAG